MSRRHRLIFLVVALCALVTVGRFVTSSFSFLLEQFWFTSGLLLLLLLSLVDQPFFSRDANIFINGATGWISLLLVSPAERTIVWCLFFIWSTYLVISSFLLMWLRSRPLPHEPAIIQLLSRLNRQIGKPQTLFSAFFLWGCARQFGIASPRFDALFIFWSAFIIIDLPVVASAIEALVSDAGSGVTPQRGQVLGVISPRIAEAEAPSALGPILGCAVSLLAGARGSQLASGVVIDDRVVSGRRRVRLALTAPRQNWSEIAERGATPPVVIFHADLPRPAETPVSVVDVESDISVLHVSVHPDVELREGELLWVELRPGIKAFYQIIGARVRQSPLPEGNALQTVDVTAGQLGIWNGERCRFEPVTWVAPAGQLVYRAGAAALGGAELPPGRLKLGLIPNSDFPVHGGIEDIVTHNTGIIGVTGSGKSFLAFHMIEEICRTGVKVLILDISRQHFIYLNRLNPVPLKQPGDTKGWLDSASGIGIYQFAQSENYPKSTADFVEEAFNWLSSKVKLSAGRNEPARLCVVFEEAHALIPEWNQVAQRGDEQHVNRTARSILQGRKFGMGAIVISQRTANVTKTILNQCNTICALQSFDQTGLDFLKNYMGERYAHAISTLPIQHAILVGKASSSTRPLLFEVQNMSTRWEQADEQGASAKSEE